ncbi:Uma2 family endonuclease [Roseofilum sp. Guam]|uniref:Uma2 family endonuclease n=1 Tax=Roseofilum sp. Guam TaxID=2821502 RepID=UPI001AFCDE57|nr:Uma2 family endonuclease [Roseofilum sp. Guam]
MKESDRRFFSLPSGNATVEESNHTQITRRCDLCLPSNQTDNHQYFKTQPNLIVEVLSQSTESLDRREKLTNYQKLESLKEYVLVSQDRIQVEVYRQDAPGNWTVQILDAESVLTLESVGLTLTMVQIYEDVFNLA